MADVGDWFMQIPPITRYWFAGSAVLPLLCRLSVISPYYVILTSDFLKNLQLWKPLTAVFFYDLRSNGFQWLMNLFFLYNYGKRLELGHFGGRPGDYLFMLVFNWIAQVGLSFFLGLSSFMDTMVLSVLYVYCMIDQDQIVSFWFGTRFKARYLPWVLFLFHLVTNQGYLADLIGILVGHLYYFVMLKYPADQGITLLQTPQIFYKYFPSSGPAPFVPPNRPRTDPVSSQSTSAPTSYNWGRGRRLVD